MGGKAINTKCEKITLSRRMSYPSYIYTFLYMYAYINHINNHIKYNINKRRNL